MYGAQKIHQFIYGRPTHVESDHKPLQYVLSKPLHQAPLRLQKMMLTLQRYDLKVKYLPGSELSLADAMSRSYLQETTETLIPDLEVNEVQLTAHLPISPEKYAEFQKANADDPTMQALSTVVLNGWPGNKEELPGNVHEYWCYRDEISSFDGLLLKAQKLIVPQSMRKEMLDRIHESHQGIVKCKQRARDILFWPGVSSQIEDKVSKCSVCNQFQRAQPREPMIIQEPPDRPWSKIGCDLFEFNGVHYLLSVDYYSKWIEVAKLDVITSGNIICHLKVNLQGTVSLMNLSATTAPSTHVQHSTILAGVMVLCTPPQVLCICSQMVKSKEPCKPLRISSRKDKIPTRLY